NWSNGGSTAAVTNLATGVYKVTITDINGCSDSAAVSVNEVGAPLITIDTVINATCIAQSGSISITVTGGASPYAYSWNNGATTEDLTGVADGAYSITVTGNGNGCKATAAALIDILAPKPVICMVTVDSVTGTNLAVWEKQTGLGIKSYNVYKESTQAGVYYKLGNVPFDSLSVFNDTLSNPLVRAWRYKLTAIDNCGNESGKSPEHKTMHVTINHGVNNSVNLIWDNYIGFNFGTFYIYRYSNLKGWSVIDSIPSNLSSYTDFNPERGFLNYAIEFIHPFGCAATRANNFNSSRSNRSQSIASPAGTTPDAIVENNSISDVMVYPNPTTGMFTLEMETLETTTIVIYDLQGKLVISEKMDTGKKQIDLSHVGRGVYHLQVISDKGMVNKKVVVN
ncbi:MAG TPA: T9SS type A sorting domain-containing protein, partial [Chitinophagaceae bacterium]|nr:T9SS type A sorting domain-containing protein [Chitinophagaceae bacterium]